MDNLYEVSIQVKKYEDFDVYERAIVNALVQKYPKEYTKDAAVKTVEEYYGIMPEVGWNCSPDEWAINLKEVISSGITPAVWKQNLEIIYEKYPD